MQLLNNSQNSELLAEHWGICHQQGGEKGMVLPLQQPQRLEVKG